MTATAEVNAPALAKQAKAIEEKYNLAFQLFGKCHRVLNSSLFLSEEEICDLCKLYVMFIIIIHVPVHTVFRNQVCFLYVSITATDIPELPTKTFQQQP